MLKLFLPKYGVEVEVESFADLPEVEKRLKKERLEKKKKQAEIYKQIEADQKSKVS